MGLCMSSNAARASPWPTTKLILPDGELREFESPVRVSQVLQREPGCFVCDADEIEFDGFVSALQDGEELRQGQLYFVLPESTLEHPLHGDDLAALTLKASRALMTAPGKRRRWRRAVEPLVFAVESEEFSAASVVKNDMLWALPASAEMKKKTKTTTTTNAASKNGTRRKFKVNLSAISE